MDFSLTYIFYRLYFRAKDFFHHWYVDGSRSIFHRFILVLERADGFLAFRVTLRHIFEPLYKDYTVIGRTIGFIFRSLRLFVGLVVYCVLGGMFLIIYFFWLMLPISILALAIKPI
ncbi:MAG: Uncharacterized protein LiPW15_576 [Parcubacteria group bacterium LiPW_15]|nr:MAG: Uncharacterized protein LiPW15_576 [Parcubacteria group bacterium LiPW_15]